MDASDSLLRGPAPDSCRVCVVVPVRNEERGLPFCLHALQAQVDLEGRAVPAESYEVLLLLNNCTDESAAVVRRWCESHASTNVRILERTFARPQAHVGTARALLMNTAWHRLRNVAPEDGAILSTDADTVVAADWIAQNVSALANGADVVGGAVELSKAELGQLPPKVRRCYEQDRLYASLIAQLEDALDPQPGDPWPRHLDHFGSSLACTPAAYAKAGGMPAVSPLEDEAFVDCVRRAGLRLRHDPRVRVWTSARLLGRAEVGMAGQLRLWSELASENEHQVTSARFLEHRFETLRRLRAVFATKDASHFALPTPWWRETFADALRQEATCPGFLAAVFADVLIQESYCRTQAEPVQEPIQEAIRKLQQQCDLLEPAVAASR